MSSTSDNSTSREDRLNAVIAEILEAAERGEAPDTAFYVRQHPDLADEVRTFLQDWRQFQMTAAIMPAAPAALPVVENGALPRRIGNYEVLERIARGGMGVVYKARQLPLNRTVAIKMLLRGDVSTPDEVRRFQAEAEAAAQLDHSGIVPIYEVGQHDGLPFFSMRYIAGENLADLVARGPLDAREAARLVREIAETLEFAHQRHVIHRDLKPSNVLLEWPGDDSGSSSAGTRARAGGGRDAVTKRPASPPRPMPRITDFGLAKRLSSTDSLTQSGQILGTPSYMAPEQVGGQPAKIGPSSDIYSLGAILYCLLTGRPPFQAADPLDTLRQVCDDEPLPPSHLNPSTPRDLETIALRCLEKSPERRFATAQDLADELDRFLDGRPICTRPVGWFERVARWSRRQPVVAALIIAITSTILLGSGTSAYFAVQQLQRRRELEQSLYRSLVMQADLEWQAGNVNRADQLLDTCQPRYRNWEWYFLKRRCHPERLTCRGHDAIVRKVVYSPGGERFASAGHDGTIRIWDSDTGAPLAVWPCDTIAMAVAWSTDGQLVAAGLDDGQVVVWEAASGRRRFSQLVHQGGVNDVAFTPTGAAVASCGDDGSVRLSDAARGVEQQRWELEFHPAWTIAVDQHSQWLAAGGEGTSVSIWDITTGDLRQTLRGDGSVIRRIAFTPDGQRLIAAGDGDAIQVWDVATGDLVSSFEEHAARVRALAVSADGSLVASGGRDGTVLVWEIETGDVLHNWKAHHLAVQGLAFRPNGRDVASSGFDGLVRVWNLDSPADVPSSSGHSERVNDVAFSPNGDVVASASRDGTVRLWDSASAELRATFRGHADMVLAVAFSRSGRWLFSAGTDGTLRRWDVQSGEALVHNTSHATGIWSVDVHPDSRRVAVGGADGWFSVCDVEQQQPILRQWAHQGQVKCVRFSPDGKKLATCGEDATVRLWNAESGKLVGELRHAAGSIWNVAFSRDGRKLASTGSDATAVIWDLAAGRQERTCVGHTGIVYAASFAPDGSRLATAGIDETVKVWDVATGLDLLTLREHHWSVNSVAFSPDGRTIASGSSDWHVRLWHAGKRGPERRAAPVSGPFPRK